MLVTPRSGWTPLQHLRMDGRAPRPPVPTVAVKIASFPANDNMMTTAWSLTGVDRRMPRLAIRLRQLITIWKDREGETDRCAIRYNIHNADYRHVVAHEEMDHFSLTTFYQLSETCEWSMTCLEVISKIRACLRVESVSVTKSRPRSFIKSASHLLFD